MKYLRYLRYLIRHKWFVLLACFKLGFYWQGIVHDASKFFPSEFLPYANHFYRGQADIHRGRDGTGYYKPTDTGDAAFDFAWLLHQKRNMHHWQFWCIPGNGDGMKVLEMPPKHRSEMLADWRGAGRAQGTPSVNKWYEKNGSRMSLAPATRIWIEEQLELAGAN